MLEQIDTLRKNEFSETVKKMNEKSDLNSLVMLRNDLAHGRNITASIAIIERYYESGTSIIRILDNIMHRSDQNWTVSG